MKNFIFDSELGIVPEESRVCALCENQFIDGDRVVMAPKMPLGPDLDLMLNNQRYVTPCVIVHSQCAIDHKIFVV
jgi:hypothetical protein